ncbi:uncharacterized protein LAESUDRAFT_751348 [Laetiporus sulphureus 93-53]|uniref:Uncharacterized protein n=1 Tax=Laetiporus sulphureus 93-53 TaxID=1314785 RepID=A0A165D168_9APHY|nr:uncharacterized protein LAESUDRAFT_751348 [Laetiporus sulphureus 93-53]KZT03934.1 hypothetical protein LAESUDRAFT_751348 [Laetiporus sulphureus 93-53]
MSPQKSPARTRNHRSTRSLPSYPRLTKARSPHLPSPAADYNKDGETDDEHTLSAFGDISLTAEYEAPVSSSRMHSLRPKVRRPPLPGKSTPVPQVDLTEDRGSYTRAHLLSHLRSRSDVPLSAKEDFEALLQSLAASGDPPRATSSLSRNDFLIGRRRGATSRPIPPSFRTQLTSDGTQGGPALPPRRPTKQLRSSRLGDGKGRVDDA